MAREDIGYDFEDFGMTARELEAKYEGLINAGMVQHPTYVRTAYAVYASMPTRDVKLPYWDWVVREIKKDHEATPGNVQEPSTQAYQDQLTEKQVEDTELVNIETVDQFAAYIAHWHANRLAQLQHFLDMPEGQTVTLQIQGKPEEEVVLTGEAFAGFRAGVLTAVLQFDSLPFAVSAADAIDPPVSDDASSTKH